MTYEITNNTQYGSIEIYFDGKPAQAIRDALKLLKFRWHGIKKCWYGFAAESTVRDTILTACEGNDKVVTDGYLGATAVYGAKSQEHLQGSDLSAAIREDIKRSGIKGVTISCKTYAGGQSITATIKTTEADMVSLDEYKASYRVKASFCWICTADHPEASTLIPTSEWTQISRRLPELPRPNGTTTEQPTHSTRSTSTDSTIALSIPRLSGISSTQ